MRSSSSACLLLSLALTAACGAPLEQELGAESASLQQGLWGFDRFLYLRCSSTSFELTDKSRFRATVDPEVFRIPLEVREPWMLTQGENCVVTETQQRDVWGGENRELGTTDALAAPASTVVRPGAGMFRVRYPQYGRFQATINVNTWTIKYNILDPDERWRPAGDDAKITVVTSGGRPELPTTRTLVGLESGAIFETLEGTSEVPRWTRKDRWVSPTTGAIEHLPNSPVTAIAIDPSNDQHMIASFAGIAGGPKVMTTTNAGSTWDPLRGIPLAEVWSVSFNPLQPNIVYAFGAASAQLGDTGAFASNDGGRTWVTSVVNDPLLPPGSAGRISAATVIGSSSTTWIGTTKGEVWVRTGGAVPSFSRIDQNGRLPQRGVTRITASTENVQTPEVYVTFTGLLGDNVWSTRNGGSSWQTLNGVHVPTVAIPNERLAAFGISVNPANTNELFLFMTDNALRSLDRGTTWK